MTVQRGYAARSSIAFAYRGRQYAAENQGQERLWGERQSISGPRLHEGAALPVLYNRDGGFHMNEKTSFDRNPEDSGQPESFYVDGCKVTVHYSEEKNPGTVRKIRDILLSASKGGKS